LPEYNQVISTPIAVNLNDDNGDGVIDEKDVTDIIAVTFNIANYRAQGVVRALSGIDGEELWKTENLDGTFNYKTIKATSTYSISAADVNNDGLVKL